jgi:hypothetical protein
MGTDFPISSVGIKEIAKEAVLDNAKYQANPTA